MGLLGAHHGYQCRSGSGVRVGVRARIAPGMRLVSTRASGYHSALVRVRVIIRVIIRIRGRGRVRGR